MSPRNELGAAIDAILAAAALEEEGGQLERALLSYRKALRLAVDMGETRRARRAVLELTRALLVTEREAEALDVLAQLDDASAHGPGVDLPTWADGLDARDRLIVARAWLAASGRYRRASALDLLISVLEAREDAASLRAALRLACRHVDRVGTSLTEVEFDRLRSLCVAARCESELVLAVDALIARLELLRGEEAPREAELVRAALAGPAALLVPRARAVRDRGSPGPRLSGPLLHGWLALATLSHVAARRPAEARACLRELDRERSRPSAAAWTAVTRASRERALREEVQAPLSRWLSDPDVSSPPRGFLDLADPLERAGLVEHAGQALHRARQRHEAGARMLAIEHAIRRAWSAYAHGDRHGARALLTIAIHDARAGTGTRSP